MYGWGGGCLFCHFFKFRCVFLAQLTDFFSDDIRSTLIWKIFSMWFLISVYKCKKVQRAQTKLKSKKTTTTLFIFLGGGGQRGVRGAKTDWAGSQAREGVTYGTNQN